MKTNCFRVVKDQLRPGIPFSKTPPNGYSIALANGSPASIPISLSFSNSVSGEDFSGGFILRASPASNGFVLECGGDFDGFIVAFDSGRLNFGQPFLNSRECLFWAGGEWHDKKPLWRVATDLTPKDNLRRHPEKLEGWAVRPGQRILLCSTQNGLRVLSANANMPYLMSPTFADVAEYLLERGGKARSIQTCEWAMHALRQLAQVTSNQTARTHYEAVKKLHQKFASGVSRSSHRQASLKHN